MKIPLYKPYFGPEEKKAAIGVLDSKCFTRGKEVSSFEKEFAAYVGKKYAIAVNSGTSGLHLLVKAMGWKHGDEIITSPFSYIATSNALIYEKIKPIFVDIDEHTLNINTNILTEKISDKTRGILNVHILGFPSLINKLPQDTNVNIIEDACEAIGQPSDKFPVNQFSKAAVYSLHENKPITSAGEGGIITTDDQEIADFCSSMRDQGRSKNKNWLENVSLGYNYRMTEIQAAIARAQLKKLPEIMNRRQAIASKYNDYFKNQDYCEIPYHDNKFERSWFTYYLKFKNPSLRDHVKNALEKNNIQTNSNLFTPIHLFPHFKNMGYKIGDFPVAEKVHKLILGLPFFPEITDQQQNYIAQIIKKSASEML